MQCPQCHAENRKERRFCAECGASLSVICSACGFSNEPEEKFCGGCGLQLADDDPRPVSKFGSPSLYTPKHLADKILQSKIALEGERKQVTALFCDIANSTVLANRLGPEGMHTLLNQFFELALAEVHRYEGTINQFLGDGFMALFGAPIGHEDHARRAALAALNIQKALQSIGIRFKDTVQVRMGLNTGLVVIGAIGDNLRMDYTAVGDTTNLAARLQQLAEAGQIVTSDSTRQAVEGYCKLNFLGDFSLKGMREPVPAWEVVADRGVRTRLEIATETGLTAFVGRERELMILQQSYEKALAGQGQMVFIIGEPGIGKSRLLLEFHRRLDTEATWCEGHSLSFGWSIAYHPLIDLLKRNFRIEENDSEELVVEKIERSVLRLGADLKPLLPYLRYLLAVDPGDPTIKAMEPQLRRAEIFDGLRRLTLRAAEIRPQVMVFEDLHWMDQATQFYLRFITDSIPAGRLLLLFTYRPGYINPIEERTFQTRIALGTLSAADSVQMARSILAVENLPANLQTMILRKAEGNPFFVEEVMKSLKEVGAIRRSEDSFVLTLPPSDVFIPDKIQDVIQARIDRLDEAPKKTLQLAAVIGRKFTYRLLDRLAESRGGTEAYLQELKALELVYEKDLYPELAFMFKHALTQEVAYNSLLEQRRRELHCLIGRAVEELYADRLHEHYEIIAYHYAKGEDWRKAMEFNLLAAEKATQSFANREALAFYDQALEITELSGSAADASEFMSICEARSNLYLVLNDFQRSIGESEKLLAIARQQNDRLRESKALTAMGYASLWHHDFSRAVIYANKVIEIAQDLEESSILAGGHFIIGEVQALTGQLAEAKPKIDRAIDISRSAGDRLYESLSLGLLGSFKNWSGEYTEAVDLLSEGYKIAKENNLLAPLFDNLFTYGIALTGKGDYDRAITVFEEGLAFTEKVGDEIFHLRVMNSLGWLYMECGDLERSFELNMQAAQRARKRGDPETAANAELNLSDIFILRGDFSSAQEFLKNVDRLAHDPTTSEWMKWRYTTHLYSSFAELWLARGDLNRAQQFGDRCLDSASRTNSRKYIVKGWRLKGEIAAARKQWDEAQAAFQQALSVAEVISNPTQLWKTHFAMGKFYTAAAKREKARVSYQAARDVIDHVKAGLQHPGLKNSLAGYSLIRRVYELSRTD
jgi:class 3 adenylate cyclase/tetratricopeptide (TPR) repeat protein